MVDMVYNIESTLVEELAAKWSKEKKLVVKELTVPIVNQIYYDNFLENREYVRIDLAAYEPEKDEIIFVEAENGLYLQHPQIYLPFCNHLFILCPEDESTYREEQIEWSKKKKIGIIEKQNSGELTVSLTSQYREISPSVKAFVKSRIFKKVEKEKKKNARTTN